MEKPGAESAAATAERSFRNALAKIGTHPDMADELSFYLGKACEQYAGEKTPAEVAEMILAVVKKDQEAGFVRQPMNVMTEVLANNPPQNKE